jgi:hypothetical protein
MARLNAVEAKAPQDEELTRQATMMKLKSPDRNTVLTADFQPTKVMPGSTCFGYEESASP